MTGLVNAVKNIIYFAYILLSHIVTYNSYPCIINCCDRMHAGTHTCKTCIHTLAATITQTDGQTCGCTYTHALTGTHKLACTRLCTHKHTHTQLPSLKSINVHLPEEVVVASFVYAKAWF